MKKQSFFIPGKLYSLEFTTYCHDFLDWKVNTGGPYRTPTFGKGSVLMFVREIEPEEMNYYGDFSYHGLWLAENERLYVFPRIMLGFNVWRRCNGA